MKSEAKGDADILIHILEAHATHSYNLFIYISLVSAYLPLEAGFYSSDWPQTPFVVEDDFEL